MDEKEKSNLTELENVYNDLQKVIHSQSNFSDEQHEFKEKKIEIEELDKINEIEKNSLSLENTFNELKKLDIVSKKGIIREKEIEKKFYEEYLYYRQSGKKRGFYIFKFIISIIIAIIGTLFAALFGLGTTFLKGVISFIIFLVLWGHVIEVKEDLNRVTNDYYVTKNLNDKYIFKDNVINIRNK